MKKPILLLLSVLALAAGLAALLFTGGDGGDGGTGSGAPRAGTSGATGTARETQPPEIPGRRRARTVPPGVAPDAVAVAGRVTTSAGVPVAGARVVCLAVPAGEPTDEIRAMRSVLGSALTDAELDELRDQMGGGGMMAMGRRGRARSASAESGGTRVSVSVGVSGGGGAESSASASDDLDLEAVESAMQDGMRIARRVVGNPGVVSRMMRTGQLLAAGFEDDAKLAVLDEARTDAEGRFRFEALPKDGQVELRVTASGHQRRKVRVAVGTLDVAVKLEAAGVLRGVVRCEGVGVPGAEVRLRTATVRASGDGSFRFDEARPGREPVWASAPGCVSAGVFAIVRAGEESQQVVIDLAPAGRITGRVTSADGAPVAGCEVTIHRDAMGALAMFIPMGQGTNLPGPDPSARTGPDGSYVVEGVAAGSMKFAATAAGYLDARSESVVVSPRETTSDVNFVLVRESSLAGRVTDAQGRPVAGAEVGVSAPSEGVMRLASQMFGGSWRTATTGADGAYRVGQVTEGEHEVFCEAPGMLRQQTKITLPPQGSATMDFRLLPGHSVSGVVLTPAGAPLADATVKVASPAPNTGNPMMQAFMPGPSKSVKSGADGRFTADGLPDGPYAVTATARGYLEAKQEGVVPGAADVSLTLGAASTIRGIVVAQDGGAPVANAAVIRRGGRAARGGFAAMMGGDPQVRAKADGTFEITGLTAGSYTLTGRGDGFADSASQKVDVAAGAVADGVRIELPPGASVSGRVTRKSDGSPVASANVFVVRDRNQFTQAMTSSQIVDPQTGEMTLPPGAIRARTDADGRFVLSGLTPGKTTLEVRTPDLSPLSMSGVDVPGDVTAVMTEGGAVEGVVFGKDGRPAEGVVVMLQRGMMGAGGATTTSGAAGRYRLERLVPGTYTAMITDPDSPMGFGSMKQASVRDGEVTNLDLGKRVPGRPIRGIVTRGDVPLADAAVVVSGGTLGFTMVNADANGRFTVPDVAPGKYTVTAQVSAFGGGNQSVEVVVAADADPAEVRIALSALRIEGVVVDEETGRSVGLAQVVLMSRRGGSASNLADLMSRQRGQTFSAQDGTFVIDSVPAGTYDLKVTAGGFAEAELQGVSAGARGLRVALSKGVEVSVTVVGPDGKPMEGVTVIPRDAGGSEGLVFDMSLSKLTDSEGVARIRLLPGRYEMRARSGTYPEASGVVDAASGASLVLRIEAGGAMEVLVADSAGAPVAGASVKVLDETGAEVRAGLSMSNLFGSGDVTDATGRAIRDGLRVGRYTVVVRTVKGEFRAAANVAAGEVARVSVTAE
ncbi:MAG: hypothetical protein HMLKMBBP_03165 [Planctomycetes bacterium]|nr:hypothetical protein [Planctomycetota bacterium]